jgi:large subunit ribosomal protein L13
MKTFSAKPADVQRDWWIIDAADKHLGHVAVRAANLLRGKGKSIFTPHVDTGDFVIVINAEKVRVGGKKDVQKSYMSFSGYVGGQSRRACRAPSGILSLSSGRSADPHNRLGRSTYRKLKVYRGSEHPHAAQNPKPAR